MVFFLSAGSVLKRAFVKKIKQMSFFCMLAGYSSLASAGGAGQITLSQNAKTDYQIIMVPQAGPIDKLAVDELKEFLKRATGADFKVIANSSENTAAPRIFVGLSPVVIKLLGNNPDAELKDQEHVVKSLNNDIFLFGKGEYGNLYAVYSFLENQLGCRWYTAYGDMLIPSHSALKLEPFDYKRGFAFQIRSMMNSFYKNRTDCNLFLYRNFQNQIINSTQPGLKSAYRDIPPGVHTSFSYLPPGGPIAPGTNAPVSWLKDKKFFDTNPEFFSMDKDGKRVNSRQLCFSNPALRRKLTEHIEKRLDEFNGKGIITLDANDVGEAFCYCDGCKALTGKYKTNGGPLFDYLLELCGYIKKKYPEAFVKTLAYRKLQTEVPPSGIDSLPENMIIIFAPIDDNFLDAMSPGTCSNLKKWCSLSKHVWVWYYPNPYMQQHPLKLLPPFANLERLAADIKIFKQIGVGGTYFEHDSGVAQSANFSDLQTWMMLKLFQNPDQDAAGLIKEFTDFYYGNAAGLMRQYISELESCRKDLVKAKTSWRWNTTMGQYTFITTENIIKWEKMFDEMEKLTEKTPEQQFHVKLARMSVDVSAILNMKKITDKYPDVKTSFSNTEYRFRESYRQMMTKRMPGQQADISAWIEQIKQQPKPLPAPFDKMTDSLQQVNPNVPNALPASACVKDSDAAWGIANSEKTDKKPFLLNFYNHQTKKFGISKSINESEISPDVYKFYKLGKIILTPSCSIFSGGQLISINLGHCYSPDEPSAEYEAYVSLKFEGPAYSIAAGKDKPNQVLCDRVVLIKK